MERLISNISKLVAIDTSNPYHFDVAVQELKALFNYSKSSVILCQGHETKALLLGVNCELNNIKSAVVFSGHIDTVNTNANRAIKIKNDGIYGLGTADMKSFFACVDYCLRKDQKNKKISTPIIVAISFDEEKDNKGIGVIIDFFKKHRIMPSQCIVGEPTNVCVATKCRGCFDFIISVYSGNAHITDTSAKNPVEICAQSSMLLKSKQSGDTLISICFFDCEKQFNVVSKECKMGFEIRSYSHTEVEMIIESLTTHLGKSVNYLIKQKDNYLLPLNNPESKLEKNICCYNNGRRCRFDASTEAGFFAKSGIDTIIFGPGDLSLAHSDDEHITFDSLSDYVNVLDSYLDEFIV